MKNQKKELEIRAGMYINSVNLVVVVMVMLLIMMSMDTYTMLFAAFPESMNEVLRHCSAIFGAIVIESFLLVILVNYHLIDHKDPGRVLPKLFGVIAGITTLYFIHAFDGDVDWVKLSGRWFIAVIVGVINYYISDLFVYKWKEYIGHQSIENKLVEYENLFKKWEAERELIVQNVSGLKEELSQAQYELTEADKHITSLSDKLTNTSTELTSASQQLTALQPIQAQYDALVIAHEQTSKALAIALGKLARKRKEEVTV